MMKADVKRQKITKALVLAAGNGKRLIDSNPKPLFKLLGLPLLARTLHSLEKAHITDAYIVLGYEADKIQESIEKNNRYKIRLHWLKNEHWRKPNGLSVLVGEEVLSEPFILCMCDHIFDPEIISRLMPEQNNPETIRLLVDYDLQRIFDLDDATKVNVRDGRLININKDLPSFNAVDTGFFLANPSLFQAIKLACLEEKFSLSDGVQKLADQGLVEAVDIRGGMWHDIDTREHARAGEEKLMASLGKPDDGPVARVLNRPLSKVLSRLLANTPVGSNLVTLMNLLLGLTAAFAASFGGYLPFLIAAFLFQLNSIFDGTDGELARLKFQSSRSGQWFDTIADNIVYIAVILGYTVGIRKASYPAIYFYGGIGSGFFGIATFVSFYIYLIRNKKAGSMLEMKFVYEKLNKHIQGMIKVITKRDTLAFGMLLLALAGLIQFLYIYYCLFFFILFLVSLGPHFRSAKISSLKKQEISFSLD